MVCFLDEKIYFFNYNVYVNKKMDKTKPYTFIQVTTAFPSLCFHSLKFLGSHEKI